MIFKNKKGFTLMELVTTTAIMATLAAVAIPSYLESQQSGNKAKTEQNCSEIAKKIVEVYMRVAPEGCNDDGTNCDGGGAIAELAAVGTVDLQTSSNVIIYYGGDGTTAQTITVADLFPGTGSVAPLGPFGQGYQMVVTADGGASFSGGVLSITEAPSFSIQDKAQTGISVSVTI